MTSIRAPLLVVLLAACGGSSADPAEPVVAAAPAVPPGADGIDAVAAEACACTTRDCLAEVDARLGAWVGTTAVNPSTTDGTVWPIEHEPRVREAIREVLHCFARGGATPSGFTVVIERRLESLRDALCACPDRACADRVGEHVRRAIAHWSFPAAAPDYEARFAPIGEQAKACLSRLPDDRVARGIAELSALRDRACLCRSATCASQIQADFHQFLEDHKDTKGSEEAAARIGQLASEMSTCLQNATGGPPPAPPPPPSP